MMTESTHKQSWYLQNFESLEKSLNGEAHTSFHQVRKTALDVLRSVGLPTQNDEDWRYTNINPIVKTQFKSVLQHHYGLVTSEELKKYEFSTSHHFQFVFVNGMFSHELSSDIVSSKGVTVQNFATAIKLNPKFIEQYLSQNARINDNAFNALNTAFAQDGIVIHVEDNVTVEKPIHLLFVSTSDAEPFVTHPRNLIVAGKHSNISIIEHYVCLDQNTYFTNTLTEVILDDSAKVDYIKIQTESEQAFHISTLHVHQTQNSKFTSHSVALGGAIVRNNIISKLDGQAIECTLNGLSLGTGVQLIDNHTTIDHAQPHCASHELYKAILDGKSRGVFNGKIFVRKDAQKTDAKQTNKTLLLSDDATIDTKPQLEIFADDVKCTHGATVGQLDANQIFYLRSRGFSLNQSRDILTTAFANDVIDKIDNKEICEYLYSLIFKKLHEGRADLVQSHE